MRLAQADLEPAATRSGEQVPLGKHDKPDHENGAYRSGRWVLQQSDAGVLSAETYLADQSTRCGHSLKRQPSLCIFLKAL